VLSTVHSLDDTIAARKSTALGSQIPRSGAGLRLWQATLTFDEEWL